MKKHLVLLMLLAIVSVISLSGTPTAPTQPETSYAQEPAGRSYLLFNESDLSRLREQAQTTHQEIWLPIKTYVDGQLGSTPPSALPEDGDDRTFGNKLIPIAFACIITENIDYCHLARDYLLGYASWPKWEVLGTRDLGHSQMLIGNAIAYTWVYDYLTSEERQIIRRSIARWGLRMYEASTLNYRNEWNNWWVSSYLQNHHWTNHSALGMAALALIVDGTPVSTAQTQTSCTVTAGSDVNLRLEPDTNSTSLGTLNTGQTATVHAQTTGNDGVTWWLTETGSYMSSAVVNEGNDCGSLPPPVEANPQEWLQRAVEQLYIVRDSLNTIADGSWHEGIHYQSYALTFYLPFAVSARNIESIELIPHRYMQNYPYWRIYNYLPGTTDSILAFGNFERWWGNSYHSQNILRFSASEYDDPQAEWIAQRIIEASGERSSQVWSVPWAVFEFIYYDASIPAQAPTPSSPSCTFPDLEAVVWRTGWNDDDLVFGLRSGAYGGRMAYDTFLEWSYPWHSYCGEAGCTLNVGHDHADANTFYLNRGGQWLAPETEGFRLSETSYHNTILIDGQGQFKPSNIQYASQDAFADTDGYLEITADTPNFNYVAADATNRYRENIPDIQDFTRHVVFIRPDYFVMLDTLAAEDEHRFSWVSHFEKAVAIDDNWLRGDTSSDDILGVGILAPQGIQIAVGDDGRPYARIESTAPSRTQRFINVLYPTTNSEWETLPEASLIEDNGRAALIQVQMTDGSTDDIMFAYGAATGPTAIGDYTFDGNVAVIRRNEDEQITRIFTQGASSLSHSATGTLLSDMAENTNFEAVFEGTTATIHTTTTNEIRLYAPSVQQLMVNGTDVSFFRSNGHIAFQAQQLPNGENCLPG